MKPDTESGYTADLCDCLQNSQTENGVCLQLSQNAHKIDPVLPAAMVNTFVKAACVNMYIMAITPQPTDQSAI